MPFKGVIVCKGALDALVADDIFCEAEFDFKIDPFIVFSLSLRGCLLIGEDFLGLGSIISRLNIEMT